MRRYPKGYVLFCVLYYAVALLFIVYVIMLVRYVWVRL